MIDPTGYLYRVAMNVLRSRYRRARVAARRVLVMTVRDEIAESDDRDELERMLWLLNRQQRSALVLTSMLGYSSEEAGTLLGDISPLPGPVELAFAAALGVVLAGGALGRRRCGLRWSSPGGLTH
jgi:hypothetical protein